MTVMLPTSGVVEDVWFSVVFGYPVYRVNCQAVNPTDAAELLRAHAAQHPRAMYYSKVDTQDVPMVRALSSAGFYVVDVNVTLALTDRTAAWPAAPATVTVGDFRPELREDVLDIAGTTFEYSRFHLDPQIPLALAHRVKHDWILNYIEGHRGDRLLVAVADGQPAGFLAALVSEHNGIATATIDLVGVGIHHRRRGVGRALVEGFVRAYRDRCAVLQVGTQVANTPSLRLYESLGFSITRSAYVMHKHAGGHDS